MKGLRGFVFVATKLSGGYHRVKPIPVEDSPPARKSREKKCRYFEWHDVPFTQRAYEYIRELKYEYNMKEYDVEGDCCRDYSDEELNEEVCSLEIEDVKAKRFIVAV